MNEHCKDKIHNRSSSPILAIVVVPYIIYVILGMESANSFLSGGEKV